MSDPVEAIYYLHAKDHLQEFSKSKDNTYGPWMRQRGWRTDVKYGAANHAEVLVVFTAVEKAERFLRSQPQLEATHAVQRVDAGMVYRFFAMHPEQLYTADPQPSTRGPLAVENLERTETAYDRNKR